MAQTNKIIDIELIKNIIIAIEYNGDNSSKTSHTSIRSSSLVISNSNQSLLDKFNSKISYLKTTLKRFKRN